MDMDMYRYTGTLTLQLHTADRVDLISALAFVISQMEVCVTRMAVEMYGPAVI